MFNSKLKKRKAAEMEIIDALKGLRVISEDGNSLEFIKNDVVKKHIFEAVLGQRCSIIDIYISTLTTSDPLKLKKALQTEGAQVNMGLIQLEDLMTESLWHLGFKKMEKGFAVSSVPNPEVIKRKLRWHDIAVWILVYNLYGNDFKAMPDAEKFIYATIMKLCFDIDKDRTLLLTGLLYQK